MQDYSQLAFHPQWQQMVTPPKAQPKAAPVKQKGKGGFLSSIISELSGAGGAAGGAAIGTALLPGVGTLIGAGLGGFLGGTGGRVVENKVRDNRIGLGDALKEGALSGVLGAGGEAFQLAKAGKAITGSSKLLHPIENIVAGGTERAAGTAATGGLEGLGKGIKASGLGLAQGAQAPGVQAIGAATSDNLVKTLTKDFGIKAGSPEAVQRALEPKLAKLGTQLTERYAKSNVALLPEELNKLGTNILQKVTTQGGLDKTAEKYALEQAQRLVKTGDIKGLWQFTKDLEAASSSLGKGGTAATSSKNAVIDIIRQEVRPFLQDKVPGLAKDNALYHTALDANKLLIKGSRNMPGGGMVGKITSLAPVKSAEAKIGNILENIGKVTGNSITRNLVRQSPASLSRAIGGLSQTAQDPSIQDPTQAAPTQDFSQVDFGQPQAPQMQQSQQPTYSLQQALMDSQRDPKNAANYLAYAKAFESQASSQGTSGQPNITKVTAQQYGLAQRGSQSLNQLAQLLQSDPNVLNRTATPGRKLPVVGGFVSRAAGTGDFDAIGYNVASALLRLETGAQANESEIKNLQTQLMPRAGDSQEVVARKLQQLNQAFNTYLNSAGVPEQGQLAGALQ